MNILRAFTVVKFLTICLPLLLCAQQASFRENHAEAPTATSTKFNKHCQDISLSGRLRSFGPLYVLGASVSHGMFSKSFPLLVKEQMCLLDNEYKSHIYFLLRFLQTDRRILRTIKKIRPGFIVSMDFPYHQIKFKYFKKAKRILDKYVEILTLDCKSKFVDCSNGGNFEFVINENYKPNLLLGSVYFDCHEDSWSEDKEFPDYQTCRKENQKLNDYLYTLEKEIPNLYILPAYEIFSALHDTDAGEYFYDVNGVKKTWTAEELFIDGFHPITNPGSYVLANLVIERINKIIKSEISNHEIQIPYLPLKIK